MGTVVTEHLLSTDRAVTHITTFQLDSVRANDFMARWRQVANLLAGQCGLVSTALLSGGARAAGYSL